MADTAAETCNACLSPDVTVHVDEILQNGVLTHRMTTTKCHKCGAVKKDETVGDMSSQSIADDGGTSLEDLKRKKQD